MSPEKSLSIAQPLASLQMLRGIAAMMVVAHHIGFQITRTGAAWDSPGWLEAGVDIFFILSGFLMWSTTVGRPMGPVEFYRRRIARIVPLYWAITTGILLVSLVAPALMQSKPPGGLRVLASYAFLFVPSEGGILDPLVGPGWTLNYEMFFYAVFGNSLLLPVKWRFAATAGVIGALAAVAITGADIPTWMRAYTSPLMLEFVAGMVLAVWWRSRGEWGKAPAAGAAFLLAGCCALVALSRYFPDADRVLKWGVPALLIFAGALVMDRAGWIPRLQWLRWTGDISYSLYLSHAITLSAIAQVWRKAVSGPGFGEPVGFAVVAFMASLAVGAAVYRWIEGPMDRFFRVGTGAVKPAGPDLRLR